MCSKSEKIPTFEDCLNAMCDAIREKLSGESQEKIQKYIEAEMPVLSEIYKSELKIYEMGQETVNDFWCRIVLNIFVILNDIENNMK